MAFFETSDGVKLYYQEKGEGNPIVFIHGWGMDHTSFDPTFEALSENYKVVTYDLRGFGSSEKPRIGFTLNRFSQDLQELIEFLDLHDVTLAGHSMGTSVIFDYVRAFGVSKLKSVTLLDMTPKLVNDESWNLGLFHGEYHLEDAHRDLTTIFNDMEAFGASFMKIAIPYLTDEMFEETMEGIKLNSPFVLAGMWHAMAVNDYRDVLEKITVPAQIVYGEKSTLYSKETAEYLHANIPNSKVIPFENCTHMLVLENPSKLTEVMDDIASSI
ncbi:alpha/beta fold hydrolase [Oceanobacillus saliphilus]|uniref:alpha/beta fold hydrolase n=1 Tax=Oceanobacillus saliphilus TaxID=2925834 RepID=UPI00201DD951|nr:alpha/beta hydrolase [Oceanobacillus saliphilus]